MLPAVLSWASTLHKMQGSTVDDADIYFRSELFAKGQAYVALSRVSWLGGIKIKELDCTKVTEKNSFNNDALTQMKIMRWHRTN